MTKMIKFLSGKTYSLILGTISPSPWRCKILIEKMLWLKRRREKSLSCYPWSGGGLKLPRHREELILTAHLRLELWFRWVLAKLWFLRPTFRSFQASSTLRTWIQLRSGTKRWEHLAPFFPTCLQVFYQPPLPLYTFHVRIAILILTQPQCLSLMLMVRWF